MNKKNYIDNEKFASAIVEYKKEYYRAKEEGREPKPMPNYIGECFLLIAKRFINSPRFIGYSNAYKEEMVGDAVENCLRYFYNFDPKITNNAFAYFSQMCYYAYFRRITEERKETYVKYKSFQMSGFMDDINLTDDDTKVTPTEVYENISTFIDEFEKALKEKKTKNKPKGLENFIDV